MATSTSRRPWTLLQEPGESWSLCHCRPDFFSCGLSYRIHERFPLANCLRLNLMRKRVKLIRSLVVKGEVVKHGGVGGGEGYVISEEEKTFVTALREAQPYVHLHRGSTFVVLISTEIVSNPCLDAMLKVPLSLSLNSFCYGSVNTLINLAYQQDMVKELQISRDIEKKSA
ncbi:putative amino-acid acetyltransferase nags2, chloroplastic [Fagus crenata]